MFERFTDRARCVIVLANEHVRFCGHSHIGTEHVLLALLQEGESVAAQVLKPALSLEAARAKVKPGGATPSGYVPFTPRCKKVLELALRESLKLGANYIAPEHLLLALIREGEGEGVRILRESGIDLAETRQSVVSVVTGGRPLRTAEQNEILGTFLDLLAGPTGDGASKREAGLKPLWKVDGSHYAAAIRHLERWEAGERVDVESGCHPLQHVAWRLLAVAWQQIHGEDEIEVAS